MARPNHRKLLTTTSGIALGAAMGMLAAAPAQATPLPAGCDLIGSAVVCTGTVTEPVPLDTGQSLTNNGTIDVTDYAQMFAAVDATGGSGGNAITNPGNIIASLTYADSVDGGTGYEFGEAWKTIGIYLGPSATVNNSGSITAETTVTNVFTNFGNGDYELVYNPFVLAFGILGTDGTYTITNLAAGTITATATHSLTLEHGDDEDGVIFGSVFAAGIIDSPGSLDPVLNKGIITATASNTYAFTDINDAYLGYYNSGTDQLYAPSSLASGIVMQAYGAEVTNNGTITANAYTTITFDFGPVFRCVRADRRLRGADDRRLRHPGFLQWPGHEQRHHQCQRRDHGHADELLGGLSRLLRRE